MPVAFQTSAGPPSGQRLSNPVSADTPVRSGPRQPGQSPARLTPAPTAVSTRPAQTHLWLIGVLLEKAALSSGIPYAPVPEQVLGGTARVKDRALALAIKPACGNLVSSQGTCGSTPAALCGR